MATLVIDNSTTVTNTPASNLNISVVTGQQINVITVTGPMGPAGPAGSGSGTTGDYATYAQLTGASGALQSQIGILSTGTVSSADLAATGAVLTARDLSISGVLQTQLTSLSGYVTGSDGAIIGLLAQTGQQAWSTANANGINLSGNLTASGAALYALAAGVSGNLIQTGSALNGRILLTSGQAVSMATSLSGNLSTTGSNLYAYITGVSGLGTGTYATLSALTSTGVQLGSIISSTGQQAWTAANTNASVISGNLTATGAALFARDAAISGQVIGVGAALSGNLASTGQQAWMAANTNAIVLSGALTQTGVLLGSRIDLVSGLVLSASGGLEVRLTQTGNSAVTHANGIGINLSGALTQTGAALFARDALISGALASTGQQLYAIITGMSGQANVNYVTVANLASTGQQAWGAADSNGRALSGNLTQTGVLLGGQISSLSGFVVGASGALQAQIVGGAGTQVRVSGSSTLSIADLTGIGGIAVVWSGGQVFVSGSSSAGGVTQGQLDSVSGWAQNSLTQTGVQLINRDTAISGGLEARITATGNAAVGHANSVGATISGNLTATGQILQGRIDLISGQVIGASGGLEVRLIATGNSAVAHANGIGQTLSGNLTQTGVQALAYSAGIGSIISGNLTQTGLQIGLISGALATLLTATGAILFARDTTISGVLGDRISGSGNSAVAHANGIGVILSGSLTTTGQTLLSLLLGVSGFANSSATSLSGQLTTTGAALNAYIGAVSGMMTSSAGALSGQLTQTGAALYGYVNTMSGYANSSLVTLSGQLTQTGVQLGLKVDSLSGFTNGMSGALQALIAGGGSQVRVTGSSTIAIVNLTGIGGTIVLYSGGQVFISGAAPGAGGGVPSVNGITSAVTIVGTGNLSAITLGQTIVISGSRLSSDKQIIFDQNSVLTGSNTFTWDNASGTLKIGTPLTYPYSPLSMSYSGAYIQATIMNPSTATDGSSDWVATSNIGGDLSGYVNLGINNSAYNQAAYNIGTGGDGYLYVDGGDLAIGAASANKVVKFHTSGSTSGALRATIDASGINLASGMDIRVNNVSLGTRPMSVTFSTTPITWSNMPAATNFFNTTTNFITYVDCAGFTGVNLVVNKGGTAAAQTGALWLGMRGDPNFTATNYIPLTANSSRILVNVASTVIQSGYQPLAPGAKSGIYIALLASGGSAAVAPIFGNIVAYFK